MLGFGAGLWPIATLGPRLEVPEPLESAFAYNLGLARHYSANRPFLNLAKLAINWKATNGASLTLNAEKYPTAIPAGGAPLFSDLFVDETEVGIVGQSITVRWDGDGVLELGDGGTITSSSANQFIYTATSGLHRFEINNLGTTGVTNVRVVRTDRVALHDSGEKYNPDWLAIVSRARVLRFLNWLTINSNNNDESWSDRPLESRYSYIYAMPYEIVIDICNRAGADLWYQAPNRIDQTYAEGIAALVRDTLDTSLTCYVEMSNETWNVGFDQTLYYIAKGVEDWGTAGTGTVSIAASDRTITGSGTTFTSEFSPVPVLVAADGQLIEVNTITNDTEYESTRLARRDATNVPFAYSNDYMGASSYVKYATQFAKWWQAIHPTRCKHLLGGQMASTANVLDLINAPDWQANEPGNWEARNVTFDGIAVATYFSSDITDSAKIAALNAAAASSEAEMLALLDGYIRSGHTTSLSGTSSRLRDHYRNCRAAGLELYAYEGGSHVVHPVTHLTTQELDDLYGHFLTWVASDDCTAVFQDLFLIHKAYIGAPFMQFDAVSGWANTTAWGTYQFPEYAGDKRTEFIESLAAAGRFWGADIPPQFIKAIPDITGTELVDVGTIRLDTSFTANATSFSASGLPAGLTLDTEFGDITGAPDAGTAGAGTITITATNAAGSVDATISYTFAAHVPIDPLAITDARVYDLTDGANLSSATGPASFGISSGATVAEIANIGDASGFNMVFNSGAQPTFNGDGVTWSANGAFLSSDVPIAGEDRSIFFAARITGDGGIIYGGATGTNQRTYLSYSASGNPAGGFADDGTTGLNDASVSVLNTNAVIGIIHDGDRNKLYVNGVLKVDQAANGSIGTLADNALGCFAGPSGVSLSTGIEGKVFAGIDAPKVLSDAEIYDVTNWLAAKMDLGAPAAFIDDEFNAGALAPQWINEGPAGTSVTFGASNVNLVIPDGDHDSFNAALNGGRIMQNVADGDFCLVARFLNKPAQQFESLGFILWQDPANWIRCDLLEAGAGTRMYMGHTLNNVTTQRVNVAVGANLHEYVRFRHEGTVTAVSFTDDPANFDHLVADQNVIEPVGQRYVFDITVNKIGLFAGSAGGSDGFTGQIDWVRTYPQPVFT